MKVIKEGGRPQAAPPLFTSVTHRPIFPAPKKPWQHQNLYSSFLPPLSVVFLPNMHRLLFFCILSMSLLLCSCNSAFRTNKTQIVVSKDVAKYLSTTNMMVHNNSTKRQTHRTVTIRETEPDTPYRLTYKKLKGDLVILQITDSNGYMRNLAIPQIKLSAYPLLLSTTLSPPLTYFALTFRNRGPFTDALIAVYNGLAITIDAYAGAAILFANPNARYTVPPNYRITNLSDVTTIDTANHEKLLDIPMPINPNPTPFLTQNYRKKCLYAFSLGGSYGIAHELSKTLMKSQTSRVNLPNQIANGIWAHAGLHFQPRPHFQWGYSFHSNMNPNTSINFLLNEIGWIVPLKKGSFELGCGVGLGTNQMNQGSNYLDSFNTYKNKTLPTGQLLEESYSFFPSTHAFAPVGGRIQFIYPIINQIEIAASFNGIRIPSYTEYNKKETLLTEEQIAPNIVAYRREEMTFNSVTVKSINRLYSIGLSLRCKF